LAQIPKVLVQAKARLRRNQNKISSRKDAKAAKLENPKSEYRNPKQTNEADKRKYQIVQTSESSRFEFFSFWSFEFVSNFGFRASNFNLLPDVLSVPSICSGHA
jgi:hypothetical protein